MLYLTHCLLLTSDYSGSKTQPCSLQPLKEAISVLFSFTRRVLDDTQFQTDIHQWLDRLVNLNVPHRCLIKLYSVDRHITFKFFIPFGGSRWRCSCTLADQMSASTSCAIFCAVLLELASGLHTSFRSDRDKSVSYCCHVNTCKEMNLSFLSQIQVWGTSCGIQQFMQALTILMSPAR